MPVRVVLAVLRRPALWPTAIRQAWRLAPTGWWRRRPFLPVPDPAYLAFRTHTQHGRSDVAVEPNDVVEYLAWCRAERGS